MACNKTVIISKIDGIWDEDKLINNKHLIYVEPVKVKKLREKVKFILNNRKIRTEISGSSRKHIEKNFTVKKFSIALEKFLIDNNIL